MDFAAQVREFFKATTSAGDCDAKRLRLALRERRAGALRGANGCSPLRMAIAGAFLGLVFYSTTAQLIWMFLPTLPLPMSPVSALEPFRIANRYGLFAVMTPERLEIEFQGIERRKDVDSVSVSLQAAGCEKGAGNLRAVPAAFRLEFVVRVARSVARQSLRDVDGGTAASK